MLIHIWSLVNGFDTGKQFLDLLDKNERGAIRMKNLDKIGVFLAGVGIFSRAILEWLRFFGVKPGKTQHWDFDWDEMILS